MHGFRQPAMYLELKVDLFQTSQMQALQNVIHQCFNKNEFTITDILSEKNLVECLAQIVSAIHQLSGFPVFDSYQSMCLSEQDHIYGLWVPALHKNVMEYMITFILRMIAQYISIPYTELKIAQQEINHLIKMLKQDAPKGVNSLRMLLAAHQKKIPWRYLTKNVFQYGYGRHSRWLDSTFTDQTSHLGHAFAKEKHSTYRLLKKAGLPVPIQFLTYNESEAIKAAHEIGYPVVLKPNNQDGGIGVHVGVQSEKALKKAYEDAKKYSDRVLIEKHIVGKDYRCVILNGQLIWAIERIPAGVIGNGINSIEELISQINQERALLTGHHATLKEIMITDETHEFLAEQGYDLKSIVESGKFIAVKRIANVTSGGIPIAVFDQVHPDNKRLVETAAKLLRLNIAGIDLIMSDIKQSYLTHGGVLIEINSQPQLGTITAGHVYNEILTTILTKNGRIPIMVICDAFSNEILSNQLYSKLAQQYHHVGLVKNNHSFINNIHFHTSTSAYSATELLLLHSEVDALIFVISNLEDIAFDGLPFDSYEDLFFVNIPSSSKLTERMKRDLISTILNTCMGQKRIYEKVTQDLLQLNLMPHEQTIIVNDMNAFSKINEVNENANHDATTTALL